MLWVLMLFEFMLVVKWLVICLMLRLFELICVLSCCRLLMLVLLEFMVSEIGMFVGRFMLSLSELQELLNRLMCMLWWCVILMISWLFLCCCFICRLFSIVCLEVQVCFFSVRVWLVDVWLVRCRFLVCSEICMLCMLARLVVRLCGVLYLYLLVVSVGSGVIVSRVVSIRVGCI